ncbi:hypothetical protein [Pseudorhodoferax sp.]|uniref:hypothetical protein n=1 Tax=Pseudorhodoferax sp. TaxID=1993553 RepID=UPI002DD69661|nr:hypothetical protein [Pseudorhodoferax sp.]
MRHLVLACMLAAASAALAQANPYEGKWTAKYTTANGNLAQAEVVVQGMGGSWDRLGGKARSDRCTFGAAPIEVASATADELMFKVLRSQALQGCTDMQLTLRRVDDKTLQGAFGNGIAVELTR